MNEPDDETRISITLTRKQWRGVKAAIGDMWSGPQDVLWDELDTFDLGDDEESEDDEEPA